MIILDDEKVSIELKLTELEEMKDGEYFMDCCLC
jgi:hypothetical protein